MTGAARRNHLPRTSPTLQLLLPACTSLATTLYIWRAVVPKTSVAVCGLALVYGGLVLVGAAVAARNREPLATDFLHPLILAVPAGLVFTLRSIQLATSESWFTIYDLGGEGIVAPLLVQALLLMIIAQLAYFSGYSLGAPRRARHANVRFPSSREAPYGVVACVALILGALAAMWIVQAGGGFTAYLDQIGHKRDVLTGRGWLTVLVQGAPIATAMYLVANRNRRGATPWLLASAAVLLTLVLGARSAFVNGILAVMLAVNYSRRRFLAPIAILLIGAIAIAYVQFFGEVRLVSAADGQYRTPQTVTLNPVSNFVEYVRTRGAGDRFLVFLSGVPHDIGFQYGATYLRLVQTLVPRRLWPDKPGLTEANVYADLFEPGRSENYATAPAGTVADYYLQFGVVSVLFISALHGFVIRRLYSMVRSRPDAAMTVGFYAAAVIGVGQGLDNLAIVATLTLVWPVLLAAGLRRVSHAVAERGRSSYRSLRPTFGQ